MDSCMISVSDTRSVVLKYTLKLVGKYISPALPGVAQLVVGLIPDWGPGCKLSPR